MKKSFLPLLFAAFFVIPASAEIRSMDITIFGMD